MRTNKYLNNYIIGIALFIAVCAVNTCMYSVHVSADEITTVPDSGIDTTDDSSIFGWIKNTVDTLFSTLRGAEDAVTQTYKQIVSFKDTIQVMIDNMGNGSSGTYTGVPVTEAIGTIRFCIGDTLFYAIYLSILFGILFTLVKLGKVVIEQITKIGNSFTSLGGKTAIFNKIKNLFKGF